MTAPPQVNIRSYTAKIRAAAPRDGRQTVLPDIAEGMDRLQAAVDHLMRFGQDTATAVRRITTSTSPTDPVVPPGSETKPGPVTSLVATRERRVHGGKLADFVLIRFGAPATGDFDGAALYMEDPAVTTTATVGMGDTVSMGATVGMAGNVQTATLLFRRAWTAGATYEVGPFALPAADVTRRFYVLSYSDQAGDNNLVPAGQPGATPYADVVFPALTSTGASGGKGVEYCDNPINPVASVVYPDNGAIETYGYTFGVQAPTDQRYAAFVVREKNLKTGQIRTLPGDRVSGSAGYWPVGAGFDVDLYFCGAAMGPDGTLLVNEISEGVTPKVRKTITPAVAGGVRTSELRDIPAAAMASSIPMPVWVAGSAVPGTYQGDQIILQGTRRLYIWNGTAYVRPIGGDGVKLELQVDKLTAAEVATGALRAYHFAGQEILVGPSSGAADKPVRLTVKDLANTLLVFMGDDPSIPFTGLYARNARFAPTPSTVRPRIDISGSGMSMLDVTLELDLNNTITRIANGLSPFSGYYAGLEVKDDGTSLGAYVAKDRLFTTNADGHLMADLTWYGTVSTLSLFGDMDNNTTSAAIKLYAGNASGQSEIHVVDLGGGAAVFVGGTRVLKSRYSGSVSTLANVISVLQHHGLCN